jgi:hypothetical protein
MAGGAALSDDGLYRYQLWRRWAEGPTACWVMLNPSTADAEQDDPTIRRCIAFSKREGMGALTVVNLFAYRATDPADLLHLEHDEAVGPGNDDRIRDGAVGADRVIVAWGALLSRMRLRAAIVTTALLGVTDQMWCLGTTKDGHPRHPLYVRGDQPLEVYP